MSGQQPSATPDTLVVDVHPRGDGTRICVFQVPGQSLAAVAVPPGLTLGLAIRERIRFGFGARLDETSLIVREPRREIPDGQPCPAVQLHNRWACPVCGARA